MFVRFIAWFPNRGSLLVIWTGTFKVVPTQLSRTLTIGAALPIAPAGMVMVVRVPVAGTPFTVFVPRSCVCTSALFRACGVGFGLVVAPVFTFTGNLFAVSVAGF